MGMQYHIYIYIYIYWMDNRSLDDVNVQENEICSE